MIVPTIYDWPSGVIPAGQLFSVGGAATDGGMTVGGALVRSPEAGGRAMLTGMFAYFGGNVTPIQARQISWLMSKVNNGSVFRFKIARSPQLVSAEDLGFSAAYDDDGLPWSNTQDWSNGEPWDFNPTVLSLSTYVEGSTTVGLDLTDYIDVVQPGHLIGHANRAYLIEDIDYSGGSATLTVSPPLRKNILEDDQVTFRPYMLATVQDPSSFRSLFQPARLIQPGSLTLTEALV